MQSHQADPAGPRQIFTNQYLFRLIWPLVLETALTITVGMADTMMVSQYLGAGREDQVCRAANQLMITVLTGGLIIMTYVLLLHGLTEETRQLAWTLIAIHIGFAVVLWPMSFTFPNFLRAANDVRYTMLVSIASMFCFRIIFSYLLGIGPGMGIIGVWIAMLIDWGARSLSFGLRYLHGDWMRTMKH